MKLPKGHVLDQSINQKRHIKVICGTGKLTPFSKLSRYSLTTSTERYLWPSSIALSELYPIVPCSQPLGTSRRRESGKSFSKTSCTEKWEIVSSWFLTLDTRRDSKDIDTATTRAAWPWMNPMLSRVANFALAIDGTQDTCCHIYKQACQWAI